MAAVIPHLSFGPLERSVFSFCPNAAGVNSLRDGNMSESLQEDNTWEDRFKLNKKADFIGLLGNNLSRDL